MDKDKLVEIKKEAEGPPLAEILASDDYLTRCVEGEFSVIFKKFDKDHNGMLDKKELTEMIAGLQQESGLVLTANTWQEALKQADKDKDGKINTKEFQDWILAQCLARRGNLVEILNKSSEKGAARWLDDLCEKAFKEADADGSGTIDFAELTTFLSSVSNALGDPPPTEDIVRSVMKFHEKNQSDFAIKLSKEEFKGVAQQCVGKIFIVSKEREAEASNGGGP